MDKNEFYKNILYSVLSTGDTTPEFVCSKFKEIVDLLTNQQPEENKRFRQFRDAP